MNDDKGYWWETVLAVLIPLVVIVVYALPQIIHKRTLGWYGAPPRTGDVAVRVGLATIGVALVFHAWYMPAYRRLPFLRWFLIILGGPAFLGLGIVWDLWTLLCSG
jgi:hypothetical protein